MNTITTSSTDDVLWEASFNPKVRTYWLLSGALFLLVSLIGIPLIPFWFIGGHWLTGRYLKHMRCTLTNKNLRVAKGMFVRQQKTVPLDKITDLGLVQGPLMRYFGLNALSVETAGQSSSGALIKLIGVNDTIAFREAVLNQRDAVVATLSEAPQTPALPTAAPEALLTDIRDTLRQIEQHLRPPS